ncbi:MAG: hypothetical protein IJK98_08705 [Clostridia bacterium]|nr:hypothetical protein [Clostridia bacterium]
MPGKKKCKILREIRQKIAEENDIPFVTEECRYKGDCKGTCPKCESELRYLEQQLEKRRSLGKAVTVSALAVGMAASFAGCQPQVSGYLEKDPPTSETVTLEGEIAVCDETEPDATADPSYDPGANVSPPVYGPPGTDEQETTEAGGFDPADNVNEDVYGPPVPDEEAEG